MNNISQILSDLKKDDIHIVIKALDYLGDMKQSNVIEIILPYIYHKSTDVRESAVCNLGFLDDEKVIPYLIEKASEDDEASVRAQSIKALENYHNNEISSFLYDRYKNENFSFPLSMIAKQLGYYTSEKSQQALIELIKGTDDKNVVVFAVDSLHKMNNSSLLQTWKDLKNNHYHFYVEEVAKKAIKDLEHKK